MKIHSEELRDWSVNPGPVAEMGIDRDAEDLGVLLGELFDLVAEVLDLGWADEGEIQGIEDQQEVLSLEGVQRHLLEGVLGLAPGLALELRCCLLDDRLHSEFLFNFCEPGYLQIYAFRWFISPRILTTNLNKMGNATSDSVTFLEANTLEHVQLGEEKQVRPPEFLHEGRPQIWEV